LGTIKSLVDFLETLEQRKIYYKLNKIRDGILVEVTIPGQRWEVEFMANGSVEIEKFVSDGTIFDHGEIEFLFKNFSD
jgi:hypothetical protein